MITTTVDGTVGMTLQSAVYSFNVDDLPDDAEGKEFAQRIYRMIEEYNSLVERKRLSDISRYSSEHEALVMSRRKLSQQDLDLQQEQSQLTSQASSIEKEVKDARFSLRLTRENAPDAMWGIQVDWDAYNKRVSDAEAVFEQAREKQERHNFQVADWKERYTTLIKKIESIGFEVKRIWAKLETAKGRNVATQDQHTGLPL